MQTGRTHRIVKPLLIGFVTIALILAVNKGCEYFPESSFQLASESRLPKWIALPPGLTRADVSVTMSYFDKPWGNNVGFLLQDAKGQTLAKVTGRTKCSHFQLKDSPQGFPPGYPIYAVITVGETTEIIEHRKPEPVFYITDDPDVLKEYKAAGCHDSF
jgi:hypothetical protein